MASSPLSPAQSKRTNATSSPMIPSDMQIRTLWLRMIALYGHKWSSAHGDQPEDGSGKTWQHGLRGINASEIGDGLQACLAREDDWPPTLPEFLRLCRPKDNQPANDWKSQRADPAKMPSPDRLAWHKANIAHIEAGGELPRPGVKEPPGPPGAMHFWDIYKGPDHREY